MTLRENLLEDFDNLVGEYRASRQETRRTLNKYAIGKWVPVSERLPEECGDYITDNGVSYFDVVSRCFEHKQDTCWLDLDMPIGKGEA